jgi:heterodisulfide reductase subunit C
MNCTTTCPSGIKVADIIEKVREFLVEKGYALPNHNQIADNIATSHNPFGEPVDARNNLTKYKNEGGGINE